MLFWVSPKIFTYILICHFTYFICNWKVFCIISFIARMKTKIKLIDEFLGVRACFFCSIHRIIYLLIRNHIFLRINIRNNHFSFWLLLFLHCSSISIVKRLALSNMILFVWWILYAYMRPQENRSAKEDQEETVSSFFFIINLLNVNVFIVLIKLCTWWN